MNIFKLIQITISAALILGITACGQTPAARFYTLSPLVSVSGDSESSLANKHIVGIGPIRVAAYLDRPEIVIRNSATHIKLAAYDRWAEPFEDIVASTLAENISAILPGVHAITDPWPEANIEYQIAIKIKKFESDAEGNVNLKTDWGILLRSKRKMLSVYESDIKISGSSADFDDITENMSKAMVKLSEEVAAELQKILSL